MVCPRSPNHQRTGDLHHDESANNKTGWDGTANHALLLACGDAVASTVHPKRAVVLATGKRKVIPVWVERIALDEERAGGIAASGCASDELVDDLLVCHIGSNFVLVFKRSVASFCCTYFWMPSRASMKSWISAVVRLSMSGMAQS